ncbi:hypothetical protein QJQ45_017341 [Haematococcus lacustris]|nr:hypothetical protein QJQ45_017341 [Haematococcus lacustris]
MRVAATLKGDRQHTSTKHVNNPLEVPFGGALWSGPVALSQSRIRLKARENKSDELRAAHIATVHASAGPRTPPGKQREERRAEWKTQRRQVIKVPGGAVLRGCKKTRRKLKAHFQLRAGIHSQLRVIASLFVLRIFLTCLVGYPTPGFRSAPTPPAVQPPLAPDAAPLPPLPMRAPAQPASMAMDWEPGPDPEPEPEPEPEPAPAPPTLRPPSARLAARHPPPAAPTGPPMPLDSEDPVMLQQLQVFCMYFAYTTFLTPYNQLQRRLGRARQNKHFILKPAFDDPSNQDLLAKLQQLGSTNFTGDHNTISHHSMQLAVAMQQHYSNPGKWWCLGQEVYLDPRWAQQRLRMYGAQDRALEQFFKKLEEDMAAVSMERHGCAKQLVVFFGAASIGTRGGWGADALLRACRKVVCRPRGTDQRRGRVVLVDEHRTTRVSSAVNGQQPCERQLNKRRATRPASWKPPAGQVEQRLVRPAWSQLRDQPVRGMMWCPVVAPRKPPQAPRSSQEASQPAASEPGPSTPLPAKRSKRTNAEQPAEPTQPTKGTGKGKGKAAEAKPARQPGRWLDRDCNAALNMQRIGESKWRPLELCYWPEQGKLPAKGKEYPGLGYKWLRDKPPKAQHQQQPAAAHADCNWLQVIKVPGGAVLRGCKKTRRKLKAHFQLRAGIHSQLRVIASLFVLRILLTCLVGYPTPGFRSAPTPPAVFCMYFANSTFLTPTTSCSAALGAQGKTKLSTQQTVPTRELTVTTRPSWMSHSSMMDAHSSALPPLAVPEHAQDGVEVKVVTSCVLGGVLDYSAPACYVSVTRRPFGGKLPAKGKEYPGLGYKRLREKPPKAQQQPAAAQ